MTKLGRHFLSIKLELRILIDNPTLTPELDSDS